MLNFEKPVYKITEYVESNNYGKFELEPLERGFGTTIGNALRRIMLSSMPGSAIVAVKIDGVAHEFQTMEGVVEDVTTIILNLKNVVVKNHTEEEKVLRLSVSGEKTVTAGDIQTSADVEIMNPDQVIATVSKGGKLDMELIVANGRGYVPSNENKKYVENTKLGYIPIDALYSPIERVSYEVESARVGQDANYDKLIMNVYTKGSIRPEEAMALSAKIMIEHLNIITNLSEIADTTGIMNAKQEDSKLKKLETSIDDLDFSVRAYNCLKRAGVNTLGDLTEKSELEMMKIRNLGKKSLKEVIDKIKDMGLKFRDED
ncbi:MAG TPA: DNA-directed RNA polymerase subunit alpha [Candidatus Fimihabitans intestinipullorum]|uniref:DNA-directed RNA polymerase subunit alpha n=1 Tax=Candidatus Fimihabitans intestinipullorum TaxID=2840820 RepID=A0A9D1L3U2_9BACT|nr:DNA-directed RNA polymerase subunit alpha [Candidatus Fimihabitans intestinipullorum]